VVLDQKDQEFQNGGLEVYDLPGLEELPRFQINDKIIEKESTVLVHELIPGLKPVLVPRG